MIALAGCAEPPPTSVLVVAVDDVRWDRSGLGAEPGHMPSLVELARLDGSVVLTHAYAPATFSQASYASFFTGRDAAIHGAGFSARPLDDDATTLAEAFAAYGYRTGAFTGGAQVSRTAGLHQGFAVFEEGPDLAPLALQVARAIEWLDDDPDTPFFLFVHGYGAHLPYHGPLAEMYDPGYDGPLHRSHGAMGMGAIKSVRGGILSPPGGAPLELGAGDLHHIAAHYDGAVRYEDYHLGRLLRALGPRLDDMLVVALSDHGEELGERGEFRHGPAITEEVIHVPVVLHFPRSATPSRAWDGVVSLVDLGPTILDHLGMVVPADAQGEVLALDAPPAGRVARVASGCCYGVRSPEWLLEGSLGAEAQRWELRRDGRGEDVAAAHADVVAALRDELAGWPPTPDDGRDPAHPDPALLEQVRRAGYWQGPAGDLPQ